MGRRLGSGVGFRGRDPEQLFRRPTVRAARRLGSRHVGRASGRPSRPPELGPRRSRTTAGLASRAHARSGLAGQHPGSSRPRLLRHAWLERDPRWPGRFPNAQTPARLPNHRRGISTRSAAPSWVECRLPWSASGRGRRRLPSGARPSGPVLPPRQPPLLALPGGAAGRTAAPLPR